MKGTVLGLICAMAMLFLLEQGGQQASADLDPPGPPVETDWIEFTNLDFTKDIGDGGGDAEICIDVRFTHPGQKLEGDPADWLKFDCWEDLEMFRNDTDKKGEKPFPVLETPFPHIGAGGKLPGGWLSPTDRECFETADWQFRFRVTEINDTATSSIIETVADALKGDKEPKGALAGKALTVVAPLLDKIFAHHDNVGTGQANWAAGEGDRDGEVPREAIGDTFSYKVKKVVKSSPQSTACDKGSIPKEEKDPCGGYNHPFFPVTTEAAASWDLLKQAASEIDLVDSQPGTPGVDTVTMKASLREFVGQMGRVAADVELSEALATPDAVPPGSLSAAQSHVAAGDAALAFAIANGSADSLQEALNRYQQAFDLLAPLLHPGCAPGGGGGIAEAIVVGSDSAAQASGSSSASDHTAPLAAAAAGVATLLALTGGGWYVRRRFRQTRIRP